MSAAGVSVRIAQNGQAYTWEEFLEYYGMAAWKRWCDAEHPDRDRPRFPGPPVVSAMASAATLPSSPYVQAASTLPASPPSPSPAPPAAAAAAPAPAGASAAAADRRPQGSDDAIAVQPAGECVNTRKNMFWHLCSLIAGGMHVRGLGKFQKQRLTLDYYTWTGRTC